MESIDLIQLVQLRLNQLQYEQSVITKNIADIESRKFKVDFSMVNQELKELSPTQSNKLLSQLNHNLDWMESAKINVNNDTFSPDEAVAESSIVSGKYKVLTELLSRKMGLMTIAIGKNK